MIEWIKIKRKYKMKETLIKRKENSRLKTKELVMAGGRRSEMEGKGEGKWRERAVEELSRRMDRVACNK